MSIPENTSKNTHNVVAEMLPSAPQIRILDIPCGAGAFTKRLMDRKIDVYPADIEKMIRVDNPNFRIADMNLRLPYEHATFGAVACIDGIEHLENPFHFVRECQRVIKPGGTLVISTPNINSLRSRWRWLWTSHHNKNKVPLNENKPSGMHHINMMSYQRLRYILHTNGFTISQVRANRVKTVSWLYAPFIPFAYLFTFFVYKREEKDPVQRGVNKVVLRHLFSTDLLFGETMIVSAIRR